LRKIREGENPDMPSPGEILPVRVLLSVLGGFVVVGALLALWGSLR
jgi:hypothetical protein